jgi:ribonuclease HI
MKVLSKQTWGQDPSVMIHLANSLVRSKLTYAQEIFFSAPRYLLKKLQSIDSKSLKLALGLPLHTSTMRTYYEANVMPLDDYRELMAAKYIVRSSASDNDMDIELNIRSDIDFPKRARNIRSYQTIATYTANTFKKCDLSPTSIKSYKKPAYFPVPQWELSKASFDIDHTDVTKKDNPNLLSAEVRRHVSESYSDTLKIYTDGSVVENNTAGSAFIIPDLKIEKSFHLGKHFSIFTAELIAILMALEYILNFPNIIYHLLLCVDSKSVLYALRSLSSKCRPDVIYQICHAVNCLQLQGTRVNFCWIPSHSGLHYNEKVDFAAKMGADNLNSECIDISLSTKEIYSVLERTLSKKALFSQLAQRNNHITFETKSIYHFLLQKTHFRKCRELYCLINRWKLEAFRTKYVRNVSCICKSSITVEHILNCLAIRQHIPVLETHLVADIFLSYDLMYEFFNSLILSPIGSSL